jgi:hypothetical protein
MSRRASTLPLAAACPPFTCPAARSRHNFSAVPTAIVIYTTNVLLYFFRLGLFFVALLSCYNKIFIFFQRGWKWSLNFKLHSLFYWWLAWKWTRNVKSWHVLLSKLADVDCRTALFRSGILAEILAAIGNSNLDPLPPSPSQNPNQT